MIYTAEGVAVWLAEKARLAEEAKNWIAETEIAAAKGEQMQGRHRGYCAAQIRNLHREYCEAARAYDDPELRFAMLGFPRAEHCIKGGKAEAPAASIVATAAPHHAHDDQIVYVADGGPMIGGTAHRRAEHGIKEGKAKSPYDWYIRTGASHLATGNCNILGDDVEFTVAASAKGGTEIKIGSHVMLVPKYLSVHHPLAQMLLFSRNMFGDTFACLKSMAPKSIFDMAKRLRSSASPNVCGADWISARPKSESPKLRTDSEFNTGKSFGSRNELAENESHPRGTDSCSKDDYLQATQRCVHMINGAEGIADQPMHDVFLIDSAAALNCTGDRNLLSEYAEYKEPDESVTGASGTVMPILGVGSVVKHLFSDQFFH